MSTPGDDELRTAVRDARDANPDLGALKLLAAIKDAKGWTLSEKRFRKALADVGGTAAGGGAAAKPSAKKKKGKKSRRVGDHLEPETHLDSTLDIATIAPKVNARMFNDARGKGLVAAEELQMGEMIWREDPFVACASPALHSILASNQMCSHCLMAWDHLPRTIAACPKCPASFCSRLCLQRAQESSHHPLLCEGTNPAAAPLNEFVQGREWRSLGIVARILARFLTSRAWEGAEAAKAFENRVFSFARVNMEERERDNPSFRAQEGTMTALWGMGHQLLLSALHPQTEVEQARLTKILRKGGRQVTPLTDEEEQRWFSYQAFLELLGMVNLNLEDSGGLYALHAHLNHSCEPNVQVRNLPKGWTPPDSLPAPLPEQLQRGTHKLTLLARNTIPAGDELTISYVPLDMPRNERQQALRLGYGFWCDCARCEREKTPTKPAKEDPEAKRRKEEAVESIVAGVDELAVDDQL
ncbi:uncharacterized protein CcaverHIS019_0304560 [Cutaneotrichosporon cavernicola]|uniref:Histone-lysine N-methyltransferase SET5 n=1 Tax=Cutaneotrichosporon cavernicola TaxID=279322 RepID=A0AA48I3E0_9TREE|nr:uncharacterized protein CcaverHIS019_0304560 [Cutaneotrichosporon cavernicola]BEI90386.1 hypothetical protein CcaverHIS019_0304560 [Cutaneotrichosporon cavernicola]BEI98162.1 hypothetical protein CcaverHIS631_0304610 [Cutaneotrichosporon cavernicola]BEJ05939.1 hypothetical protein CcaverHIS641_0304610 [Cutaneotrichosporon cavernicola]